MKRKLLIGCLAATAAFASGSAQAALTSFGSWATWNPAVNQNPVVKEQFEGVAAPGGVAGPASTYDPGAGSIHTYNSSNDLYIISESVGGYDLGSGDSLYVSGVLSSDHITASIGSITITPNGSNYTAFGLDLGNVDINTTFNVSINGGAPITRDISTISQNPTGSFFGVTSDAFISSVSITPIAGRLSLDNVSFATANPTTTESAPEPSSMALLGLGMAALGWKSRRRAKAV